MTGRLKPSCRLHEVRSILHTSFCGADVSLVIAGFWRPDRPEGPPSYGSGGEPASKGSITDITAFYGSDLILLDEGMMEKAREALLEKLVLMDEKWESEREDVHAGV